MKSVVAVAMLVATPVLVWSQSAPPATDVSAGNVAAAKSVPVKPRAGIKRSALKAVEEVTPIDDDLDVTLTSADLELGRPEGGRNVAATWQQVDVDESETWSTTG